MQEKKRKCQICGAEYKACNSCDKFRNWMSVVDLQKCYLVYLAVTERRLDITDDAGCVAALAKAGINRNNLEQKNIGCRSCSTSRLRARAAWVRTRTPTAACC